MFCKKHHYAGCALFGQVFLKVLLTLLHSVDRFAQSTVLTSCQWVKVCEATGADTKLWTIWTGLLKVLLTLLYSVDRFAQSTALTSCWWVKVYKATGADVKLSVHCLDRSSQSFTNTASFCGQVCSEYCFDFLSAGKSVRSYRSRHGPRPPKDIREGVSGAYRVLTEVSTVFRIPILSVLSIWRRLLLCRDCLLFK